MSSHIMHTEKVFELFRLSLYSYANFFIWYRGWNVCLEQYILVWVSFFFTTFLANIFVVQLLIDRTGSFFWTRERSFFVFIPNNYKMLLRKCFNELSCSSLELLVKYDVMGFSTVFSVFFCLVLKYTAHNFWIWQ